MKKIKKIYFILILFLLIFTIPKVNASSNVVSLEFYSLNDFHGSLFEDGNIPGISKIGEYLINKKNNNPDSTIILSSGDMFQGTAVSSMTRGKAVVDAMNIIGFDSMTIGNHEFDWGINEIMKFQDKNLENGEANFKFLGANVIEKETNKIPSFLNPYEIVERSGVKIGIIGLIGESQIDDILSTIVEPYEFTSQVDAVKKYAEELREEKECDIVVVSTHSGALEQIEDSIIEELGDLSGVYSVDAIFTAHTHYYYSGNYSNSNHNVPYIQSGSNGKYIGNITIEYNKETKEIVNTTATNEDTKSIAFNNNNIIDSALNKYRNEIKQASSKIGYTSLSIERNDAASWAAKVLQAYTKTDVGIINYGGIRSQAFPITDDVNYNNIFEMSPFENMVITVELTGQQLNYIVNNDKDSLIFSLPTEFENSKTYKVATVDYVFGKSYYPFKSGANIENTNIIFREMLVQEVQNSTKLNDEWTLDIVGPQDQNNNHIILIISIIAAFITIVVVSIGLIIYSKRNIKREANKTSIS